tara:strand:+ start:855 stop:1040 length:186 start_codon:yes stop_codon:yes gene_type:complete
MKLFFSLIFVYIISCGYADIDSVPDFKDLKLTKEESIELCKIDNTDNDKVKECLKKLEKLN